MSDGGIKPIMPSGGVIGGQVFTVRKGQKCYAIHALAKSLLEHAGVTGDVRIMDVEVEEKNLVPPGPALVIDYEVWTKA